MAMSCIAAVAAVQLFCTHFLHAGDATGPFLVGASSAGVPGRWPIDVKQAPTAEGYDGQFFLALALDPLMRTPLADALDDSTYRGRRILWSATAWALSGGNQRAAPHALQLLLILAVGGGGFAISLWAEAYRASEFWALAYALNLGVLVCSWRMLGDSISVSLLVGAVVAVSSQHSKPTALPWLLLALAILQKETALLALPALASSVTAKDRRKAAVAAIACGLAILAWWTYARYAGGGSHDFRFAIVFDAPLSGWLSSVSHALAPGRGWLATAKDLIFLSYYIASIVLGLAIGIRSIAKLERTSRLPGLEISILLFSALGLLLSENVWVEPWAYSRALLPLSALALLFGLEKNGEGDAPRLRRTALALSLLGAAIGVAFIAKNLAFRTP